MASQDERIVEPITAQTPFQTSTTAFHALGTPGRDDYGNEFIYVQGVASVAAGDCCTVSSAGLLERVTTTTIVSSTRGRRFCWPQAAIVANNYGWALTKCIRNPNSSYLINVKASAAAGAALYATTTAGVLDDAATEAGRITGVRLTTSQVGTDGTIATFQLDAADYT